MRRYWIATLCGAIVAGLAGCGGGGGNGNSVERATLRGTVTSTAAPRTAAELADGSINVAAVDETGSKADEALGVTGEFQLVVPTGHEYVLIFSDDQGIIGAMVYGEPGQERADFAVNEGTISLDLGVMVVDRSDRRIHAEDSGQFEAPDVQPGDDSDGDGIPDVLDDDNDNDGIRDANDHMSRDHDNDGLNDDVDTDDDNDGIDDAHDDYPMDHDNNGMDDDRDVCGQADALNGQAVYEANCAGCHTTGSIGDESAAEIASVLAQGEDDMPAFPDLVGEAADLAAYLSGCPVDGGGSGPADADGDGVVDSVDQCPDTPAGDTVDATGCTVSAPIGDADGDGVADNLDQCPNTPLGDTVDASGCTVTAGGAGDAAVGAQVWNSNGCAGCHGANGAGGIPVRGVSAAAVTSSLQNGPGSMPTYPSLVSSAADLAAFLSP